jgi:hypothetical protein
MTQKLWLVEVANAITYLPKGKYLGHDDLLIKFFQVNVEEIAPTLVLTFQTMLI